MGWHSFVKKVTHGAEDAFKKFEPITGEYGIVGLTGKLGDYAKDFKDWYDGTAAMRKSAALQDEYNMKYWQMQNAYNTPSAQMQRFIDAGLNPNLAYSLSNTAGDIGRVSVGTPESGSSQIGKVISAISAWQGIKNMRLQNDNLAYQTEFTRENARRMKIDNDYLQEHGLSSFSPSLARNIEGVFDLFDKYGLPNPLSLLSGLGQFIAPELGTIVGGVTSRPIEYETRLKDGTVTGYYRR